MRQFLLFAAAATTIAATEAHSQTPVGKSKASPYALEMGEAQRISAVLTYNVSCPDLMASQWIIAAAVAPELPGQTKPKTTLSPAGTAVKEKSLLGRNLLTARAPVTNNDLLTSVPIQVIYEATLRSRRLKALEDAAEPVKFTALSPASRKIYLAEQGDIDFKQAAFKKWLQKEKLVRGPKQGDVEFARHVFLRIRSLMRYEYKSGMDRRASAVCISGKSDCGGLSILFVSVMRANRIPARTLFGRWAKSAEPGAEVGGIPYFQGHVKAEFFAEGIGWVPLDMSAAIEDTQSEEELAFFGVDSGDFLTIHIDPNLSVDTGVFGLKLAHNLQAPAYWAVGGGSASPSRITQDWKVKVVK